MMLRPFLILFACFIISCDQTKPAAEKTTRKDSQIQYKDLAIDKEKVWALTTDGYLSLFDLNTGERLPDPGKTSSSIVAITTDKKGDIIIGEENNSIRKYSRSTDSWATLVKPDHAFSAITFDSRNNCYLITDRGIYDQTVDKYYFPEASLNDQINIEAGWNKDPKILIDKNDNIWIGFGYGEWGGDLFTFDTKNKKFITPELTGFDLKLNPITSIFETNESVYVTSGLMHFITSGSIVRFTNFKSTAVFESESYRKFPDDEKNREIVEGEYIGPGTFNHLNNCIYFYSQNGIFRGNTNADLTKIENWTKVHEPKLHWTDGQADAVGSPMNVLKLLFSNSGKLIFLSQIDGVGIYDGNKLLMAGKLHD